MSSIRYSRLPSHVPPRKYKFQALEGPGYFTYDAQPGKYSSMFSYSRMSSADCTAAPSDGGSSTTVVCVEAPAVHEQIGVYGDQSHPGAYTGGLIILPIVGGAECILFNFYFVTF